MRNKDIKQYYRYWGFTGKVPLIAKEQQWKAYFEKKFGDIDIDIDVDEIKETIENTINETLETDIQEINNNIQEVNTNIETSKNEINSNIEAAKNHLCCDICCAKNDIKRHIDDKIDPIQFEEKFSNLNEQVAEIIRRLDNN